MQVTLDGWIGVAEGLNITRVGRVFGPHGRSGSEGPQAATPGALRGVGSRQRQSGLPTERGRSMWLRTTGFMRDWPDHGAAAGANGFRSAGQIS